MVTEWEQFNHIEKEYELNILEIDDCNYWQYGRAMLMNYLTTISFNSEKSCVEKTKRDIIIQKCKKALILVRFLIRSRFMRNVEVKNNYDILFVSAMNRVNYEGVSYNSFIDPVMNIYDNSIMLEPSYMFRKHTKKPATKNLIYIDKYEANAIIAYYLHRNTRDFRDKLCLIKKQLKEPMDKICKLYGIKKIPEDIYYNMVDSITRRKVFKKYCKEFINKVAPRVIIETCHYSFENLVLNETAYEMGIPTIELQHGSAGKGHYAYNYSKDMFIKQFPMYFFAFSRFWIDCFSLPIQNKNIFSVGAPYKEMRSNELRSNKKKDKIVIVFLSEANSFSGEFIRMAEELFGILDKSKYEIVIKLHPEEYSDWKDRYGDVSSTDIRVIDSNVPDLYELFSEAVFQVCSYNSTAIYEGLLFDLVTLINIKYAGPEFLTLCEKGYAKPFSSVDELYNLITSYDFNKKNKKNEFWEDNSLLKMKETIDHIIQNSIA